MSCNTDFCPARFACGHHGCGVIGTVRKDPATFYTMPPVGWAEFKRWHVLWYRCPAHHASVPPGVQAQVVFEGRLRPLRRRGRG